MSCKLIFIRHGQSLGNVSHTFLGHTNLDLSELGFEQAKATAKYLANKDIDAVYSSDLLRAYHTCKEYLNITNHEAVKLQNLREIFAGDWEGKKFDTLQVDFADTYAVWLNNIGLSCPKNGESVEKLSERVVKCITEIAQQNDGKTVAVFTHATVIRSFFNFAYGKTLEQMKDLHWPTNASVSSVAYENGCFKVLEYSTDFFLDELKTGFPANV